MSHSRFREVAADQILHIDIARAMPFHRIGIFRRANLENPHREVQRALAHESAVKFPSAKNLTGDYPRSWSRLSPSIRCPFFADGMAHKDSAIER
jgi:hypothetical protein